MLYYPQLVSLSKIKLTNEDDRPTYSIVFASSSSCFSRLVESYARRQFLHFSRILKNVSLIRRQLRVLLPTFSRLVESYARRQSNERFRFFRKNSSLIRSQLSRLDTQLKSRNQNQIADLIPAFIILEFPRIAPYYFFILFLSRWLIILSSY